MTKTDETEGGAADRPGADAARKGEAGAGADAGRTDAGPGDVESAGETTAAAVLGGDTSAEKPVGADTLVEVVGDPRPEG